jgi:hypothetical protein
MSDCGTICLYSVGGLDLRCAVALSIYHFVFQIRSDALNVCSAPFASVTVFLGTLHGVCVGERGE